MTSIGRRRNIIIVEIGNDTSTSASPLEGPVSNVDIDGTNSGHRGFTHSVPSSSSPRPFTDSVWLKIKRNVWTLAVLVEDVAQPYQPLTLAKTLTTKEKTTVDTNPTKSTDIFRHRCTTVPSFSNDPTTENYKPKHDNAILRRRSTTVPSTDILANENGPIKAEDSVAQTIPPSTVPTTVTESTSL